MKQKSPTLQATPLKIVGSCVFGRYKKISSEKTMNMIISDEWLVDNAGYLNVTSEFKAEQGRGIFNSTKLGKLVAVIDNGVYLITPSHGNINNPLQKVGSIDSYQGNIFMDENDAKQIAICDQTALYIYDYGSGTFNKLTLDFIPNYVCFHDGYFICPEQLRPIWRLSAPNNGFVWPTQPANEGSFQTKPDLPVAVVRMPGKGNLVMVMGSIVTEAWIDTGAQLFPYQRNSYFNIDFGCLNPATIATNGDMIVWLASNEKSGPVLMYSNGGVPQAISTDGINFELANLSHPTNSYGFMFRQDGHLLYQFTFPADNLSYIYDFNTEKFFLTSDEFQDYHIARQVAYFNNSYFFVSFRNGSVYELNSKYTTYDGEEIPRIRVTPTFRTEDSSRFIVNNCNFRVEMGQGFYVDGDDENAQRIDHAISLDGGETFSNFESYLYNQVAYRQNRVDFWNSGMANEMTHQFRFYGKNRVVAGDGVMSYYQ